MKIVVFLNDLTLETVSPSETSVNNLMKAFVCGWKDLGLTSPQASFLYTVLTEMSAKNR
jgi:hypothetical protein